MHQRYIVFHSTDSAPFVYPPMHVGGARIRCSALQCSEHETRVVWAWTVHGGSVKVGLTLVYLVMDKLLRIGKNKHFKSGAPFVLAIIGSAYGLKYYSEVRFQVLEERHIISKTKELQQLTTTKQHTIEEEYEDYRKTVDLDNWKNIRGPRPWENDNKEYKELIEKRAQESKQQWVFK